MHEGQDQAHDVGVQCAMGWDRDTGDARTRRLPADWYHVGGPRERVLERDGNACQWPVGYGNVCGELATHVDHIEHGTTGPVPDDDLQALCEPHHRHKTSREGGQANAARYARRPAKRHPGLLW